MNYDEALVWVLSLAHMGKKAGPARMKNLLAALGNPQGRLCFVHIAGTNGKGSLMVMTAAIVKEAGYRVGANLSPYVASFRERFMINGEMIPKNELAAILTELREKAAALNEPLIHFEAVTAAALLWFARRQCDIVCFEVGIGGRKDCTNVIETTLVSCITRIGLDHTDILGDTLTEIAAEKCGILRPGVPVVSYPLQPPQAGEEITRQAKRLGAPLVIPSPEAVEFVQGGGLLNSQMRYAGLHLALPFPGQHQAYNAAMAVEVAHVLAGQGYEISEEHITVGIAAARIPARIEVLCQKPLVIVDGAHNADGAAALAATLATAGLSGLTAVCGVLRDKQAEAIVRAVAPQLGTFFAVAPASPRALPAKQLAELAKGFINNVEFMPSLDAALSTALEMALQNPDGGVLVFGSLYLAGQARKILLRNLPKNVCKGVDTP